ncbi:diacylglycerol O-acyltransferase 1-like isoform X2 [Megalops cyprinoides]|uniref:diacylglycerol O-acyltransferase 1-like isoform X2 n=1 Tax=Megalops cyprinoides TaxID=118141 RepID=UPI001864D3A0|nr:diacylglycerol O-acyltransferase 1-like isoform X2 [Megalops cyprinoides]
MSRYEEESRLPRWGWGGGGGGGDRDSNPPCDGSDADSDPDSDPDMFCCHRARDSLLSSERRFASCGGILTWTVVLLVLTHAHLFLENFIQHGFLVDLRKVLDHVAEGDCSSPSVRLVLGSNVFAVAALVVERTQDKGKVSPRAGRCLHVGNLVLIALLPAAVVLKPDTRISTGGALLSVSIYTILAMKLYSYQETNRWYRQERNGGPGSKGRGSEEGAETADHLTLGDLYYFLLAPTLCYQKDFPRTPKIRIHFLFQKLLEMVILTQLLVGIVQQWIAPIFQRSDTSFTNMDFTARVEHLVELVAPNHFLCLTLFFLLSHSSLNFSAELLRFGDRRFYGDWWNADNLKTFWRKWSVPLHRWSHRHLYTPLVRRRVPANQAELIAFLVSAGVCEYVVALPLRTCRLWVFLLMVAELLVAVIFGRLFAGNCGNGLVWLCLLLGPPLAATTYFHDHYITDKTPPPWTLR